MIRASKRGIVLLALSAALLARADQPEPIDKLIARANAGGEHKTELCVKVIRREVELANADFTDGKVDQAFADVDAAVSFADKALDSAQHSRKDLKQSETLLRQASRRLNDIEQTLAFEDRPRVKEAVDHLERVRSEMLKIMFAPEGKHKS